ncbi:hypothetical protein SSS_09913 [Sarcoptes scabiei]|nr:hypothetical protein SSS_09913 [Sarcoptes scabiei]
MLILLMQYYWIELLLAFFFKKEENKSKSKRNLQSFDRFFSSSFAFDKDVRQLLSYCLFVCNRINKIPSLTLDSLTEKDRDAEREREREREREIKENFSGYSII